MQSVRRRGLGNWMMSEPSGGRRGRASVAQNVGGMGSDRRGVVGGLDRMAGEAARLWLAADRAREAAAKWR